MRFPLLLAMLVTVTSAVACQTLLDFDQKIVNAGSPGAEGGFEGGNAEASLASDSAVDATRDGGDMRPARRLWEIGGGAVGIATTVAHVHWNEGQSLFTLAKAEDAGAPTTIAEPCNLPLVGPVAFGNVVHTACGRQPGGGYVIRYDALAGGSSAPHVQIHELYSDVLGLATSSAGTGLIYAFTDTAPRCVVRINEIDATDVACTPARTAAANESSFFYVDPTGLINRLTWAAQAEAPLPRHATLAGISSMSATSTDLFVASAGGLARIPLAAPENVVIDGNPSTLVAVHGNRVAFTRGSRVWLTTIDLTSPTPLSNPDDVAEQLAIDADGVYWKAGAWLWVAPFCRGAFCD